MLALSGIPALGLISIDPEIKIVNYEPGRVARCVISVTNRGNAAADVEVQPEDWTLPGRKSGCAQWLNASPRKFRIGPGKSKKIKLSALIRDTTSPYYVTSIFFASVEKKAAPLNIGTRVGSMIKWVMDGKK